MKRCGKCGKIMADRAQFCPVCGARVDAPAGDAGPVRKADKPRRKKRRLTRAGMLLLGALALLAIFAVLLITGVIGKRGPKLQSYTPAETAAPVSPAQTSGAEAPEAEAGIVEIPTLTGLDEPGARQKLTELGLVPETEEAGFDSAYADGAVLSQSVAPGAWANAGDTVLLTVNRLPLTFQATWTEPRSGRLLLGNLVNVCKGLGTANPNFTYTVEMVTEAETYSLSGGFRCLTGPNEAEPVSRLSGNLYKSKQNIGGVLTQMVAEDHVQFTFEIDNWTGFNDAYITAYRVTVASKENPEIQAGRTFSVEQAAGGVLMSQGFDGGWLTVEATGPKQLLLRLTDDRLPDGYACSPMKGSGVPLWDIKLFQASYKWIDVQVDGRDCPSVDAMNLVTTQLYEEKSGKGAAAAAFSGASYTAEGNDLVITVNLPGATEHDPFAMNWVELTIGGQVIKMKMK